MSDRGGGGGGGGAVTHAVGGRKEMGNVSFSLTVRRRRLHWVVIPPSSYWIMH